MLSWVYALAIAIITTLPQRVFPIVLIRKALKRIDENAVLASGGSYVPGFTYIVTCGLHLVTCGFHMPH